MAHLIPSSAINRYTAAPAPTTVSAVQSLHNSIRSVLGSDYETFLQGSYRNDTSIADLNDVDIVALRKTTTSTVFTGITPTSTITWDEIFSQLERQLNTSALYKGKTERGDKCITVNTNFHADVVPAVKISDDGEDPITIFVRIREGNVVGFIMGGITRLRCTVAPVDALVFFFRIVP